MIVRSQHKKTISFSGGTFGLWFARFSNLASPFVLIASSRRNRLTLSSHTSAQFREIEDILWGKKFNCRRLRERKKLLSHICFFRRCSLLFALTRSVVTLRWSFFLYTCRLLSLCLRFSLITCRNTKHIFSLRRVMKRQLITFERFNSCWRWMMMKVRSTWDISLLCFLLSLRHHHHPYIFFHVLSTQPESLIYYTRMTFA